MRFRQIHLDFHTSGLIDGIGSQFDPDDFADAFVAAHVDSVNLFAKCHHGYSYHPTKVGTMHPGLDFDLLGAQINALQNVGIKTPVYISAAWDELSAQTHPEWRIVSADGSLPRYNSEPTGPGWAYMDFGTGYLDYLCAQIRETLTLFPNTHGLWLDICWQPLSISEPVKARMRELGLDWTKEQDLYVFNERKIREFYQTITDTVSSIDPKYPVFFNSSHIIRGMRAHYARHYSHLELESLPTAFWGYDHFPLSARYVDQLGMDFLGMTGKFHWIWGEIGGYKKPEALLYEAGQMLAHGARCNVGDHLHPTGKIDRSTISVIAPAYKWVEEREPWAINTENLAEIGVLSTEAMQTVSLGLHAPISNCTDEGVARILLEGKFTFDVIDLESDFTRYKLLILPDVIEVNDMLKEKVDQFVALGGRVLMTGKSGLSEQGFIWDVGAKWEGTSPNLSGDYVLPIEALRAEGINDPLFVYKPSERIALQDGQSLGQIFEPYFDRTAFHFSGHVNTPHKPDPAAGVCGVAKDGFVYFAFPLFSAYREVGAVAMLEMAEKLIQFALNTPRTLEVNLPRAGRATLRRQASSGRDVLHLLYATPTVRGNLRGNNVEPIQDLVTLNDIGVMIRGLDVEVASVRVVPEGSVLEHTISHGAVSFVVPEVRGHQMIELVWGQR